jgi:hypothetical protein
MMLLMEQTVTGETHTLIAEGLVDSYESKSSNAVVLGDDTIAKFSFEMEIEAVEDTFYISEAGAIAFGLTLTDGTLISATIVETDAVLTADDSYRINEGQNTFIHSRSTSTIRCFGWCCSICTSNP